MRRLVLLLWIAALSPACTSADDGPSNGSRDSCAAGNLQCSGVCADPMSDPLHCGSCEGACEAGQVCQSGVCSDGAGTAGTGGTAIDGSGGADGSGGTFSTQVVIEEGALGQCSVDGIVESTNGGFSGTGYLNTDNVSGAGIEWALNIGEAGDYALEFAYANGSGARPAEVVVNGGSEPVEVQFPPTADWTTWSSASANVTLGAGENRVVLRATGAEGLANIDRLTVTGAAVSAFDCDGAHGGNCVVSADGHYQMEDLDRGVVAVRGDNGNYVGWRMMGYEYRRNDPSSVSYKLYRDGALVATVTDSTNYWDAGAAAGAAYSVSVVMDGTECEPSSAVTPWAQDYVRIPLEAPADYEANDASPADLDGDGQYELVLKWQPNNAKDNSQSGHTDNTLLEGLELDGTSLWRIDLGRNIRSGAHYTQFIVYDFDGDGKAEIAVKTAPGTRDGTGAYLSKGPAADADHSADYRNDSGYILTGPEYLTVFSGATGAELATTTFEVGRENVSGWGNNEGYGNRVDRFLATAAYLDETGLGSIVMARGYYGRSTLTAWNYRDGELTQLWKFDSNVTPEDASGKSFAGQGCHSLSVANVDDDPQQEIIYGAMTIDHDGNGMCSTGFGHGDALHVTDLIPSRPGLEAFMPHENTASPHWTLRDPATCEIIHQSPNTGADTGRGVAADVDPDNPGAEMWASGNVPFMSATTAETVGSRPSAINFVIWWDGDESRELQDGTTISKYGQGDPLLSCAQCSSNNGTKSTPTLTADLFGDWREEIIWRESNNSALRIYTTTHLTERRIYTLMHDPQYRVAISWQNVAYNQPPHPSFHIGSEMADPPATDIGVR